MKRSTSNRANVTPAVAFIILVCMMLSPMTFAQMSGFTFNGIVHDSFQTNEYNTSTGSTSRQVLASTHANWAAVLVTQYQANATAFSIAADPNRTPTDAAVIAAIQDFHSRGIKVMLKPHVDSEDGAWRGTFQPGSNVAAWFASYTTFITHYAQLAQQNGVEGMVIGTEFVQLSGSANQARWQSVISTVRSNFTGILTYAANAVTPADEFTSVSFWDQLDYIGLDAYYRLTNTTNPTIAQLVAAWTANSFGEQGIAAYQNIANAHPTKPVIFTEIGYRSVDGANEAPYDFGLSGAVDDGEQRDCAEAMFEVWSTHSFMKGMFWWDWQVPAPNVATDTNYTPYNKVAQGTFTTWFGTGSSSSFSLSASPTSLSINQGASGTSTITITRTGGFASAVSFTASGLPSGVTASFNPSTTSTSGTSSVLTLTASGTATTGNSTVTITGTGGGQTHTTTVSLTVNPVQTADFSLSANPTSLTITRGSNGTSTITITRTGGFASAVSFTASGLPSGVSASFNPTTTTSSGTSSVLTLTASATATTGATTVTVTGTGGGLTHTTIIALTVASSGGGGGGVTVTPVVSTSSPYYNEEDVKLANTANLTALSVTIVIQRTTGISFSGQYNTIGGQITQGNTSTTSTVTYTYTLNAGQAVTPGSGYLFAAQTSGTGTTHPTAGDTYTVTYTTGGQNFSQSGHF
jgi:hypothetical protein